MQGSAKQCVWIILKVSKKRISTSTFLKGATPLYYHLLRGQTPPPTSQIWTAIKITTFMLVACVLAIGRVAIMVMVNGSVSFNCITFNLTDYSNHVMSTLAIFMLLLDIAIGVLIYYTQWKDTPLERFTSFMHSILFCKLVLTIVMSHEGIKNHASTLYPFNLLTRLWALRNARRVDDNPRQTDLPGF